MFSGGSRNHTADRVAFLSFYVANDCDVAIWHLDIPASEEREDGGKKEPIFTTVQRNDGMSVAGTSCWIFGGKCL